MNTRFTTLITALMVFAVLVSAWLFLFNGGSYTNAHPMPSLTASDLSLQNITANVPYRNAFIIGPIIEYIAYPFLFLATIIAYIVNTILWAVNFFIYIFLLFPPILTAPFLIILSIIIITSVIRSIKIAGSGIE